MDRHEEAVAALREAGAEDVNEDAMCRMRACSVAHDEPPSPKRKKKGCVAWIAEQNSKGHYVNCFDEHGQSLMHIAVIEDSGSEVVQGLVQRSVDVNHVNKKGESPLFTASSMGMVHYIPLLHKAGARYDVVTRTGHPMHGAAANGQTEAMELLLQDGHSIEEKDFDGSTPLHAAAAAGEVSTVRLCVETGTPQRAQRSQNSVLMPKPKASRG